MSQKMFNVIFYMKSNGACPVEDFLDNCDVKMRAKLIGLLEILQDQGSLLREPYSKQLEDGIFEIRAKVSTNISRVLYFFDKNRIIVLTNAYHKKSQKLNKSALLLAKKYRNDCMNCKENNYENA